jgi:CubicO group peptidase (beta-lactamase class C family)
MHIPVCELENQYFASLSFGDNDPETFRKTLEGYAPFVHFSIPFLSCDQGSVKGLMSRLKSFDMVVVGLNPGDMIEVGENIVDFFNQLSLQTKLVLVFFTDIRDEADFSNRAAKVFVHEGHPYAQQIAAQIVFGGFKVESYEYKQVNPCLRLAFGLPEEEQMDSRTLERIKRIVREAISREDMPGCEVLVARNGRVIYNRSFGYYTYDSIRRVTEKSIYDLASITKVASTTQLIMWLTGNGQLNLNEPMGHYLPGLKGTNKENLIIRDVLFHQAGLKPFYPFWRYTIEDDKPDTAYYHPYRRSPDDLVVIPGLYASESIRDSIWHWTVETALLPENRSGGYDYEYSDLGFYLLQQLIEKVSGMRIDSLADSVFYRPMGMATMTYLPLCRFPRDRMVPTEKDNYFRQDLIWGTVHDPVAAMVGGVAGHAGLFSNAVDLAKLMQMNLNYGKYGGRVYLSDSVVQAFISQKHKNNRRGLGWDKPENDEGYNPASRYASWLTYGHRGFTGTAVWVDPTFQLIYVFLSNRVCKDPEKGRKVDLNVRRRVHDMVYESMWNYQKVHNH